MPPRSLVHAADFNITWLVVLVYPSPPPLSDQKVLSPNSIIILELTTNDNEENYKQEDTVDRGRNEDNEFGNEKLKHQILFCFTAC